METQYVTRPADAYQGKLPTKELRRLIRSAAQVESVSEEQAEAAWMKIVTEIEKSQTITPPAASPTVQQ